MKKFLLSCFVALGISSSAQYTYTGDFEDPNFTSTTYKQFGGGSRIAAAACNGAYGGEIALPATDGTTTQTSSGYMIDLNTLTGQTNNGQKLDFSFGYKKGSGLVGTIQPAYFVFNPEANNWTVNVIGSPVSLATAAISTCSTLSATIPAGVLQPGKVYGVGSWITLSSGAGSVYVDDINLTQQTVTNAPVCTTITYPTNGTTVNAGNLNMTWAAAPIAVNYKVTVGTTAGASDVFNGTVAGTSLNLSLAKSSTYFATVIPSNLNGDARDCTEISFTTNATIAYCGGIISTIPAQTYPISSISLNGVTKSSAATVGSVAYEDFTSTVFNVNKGVTYNLNAIATGLGTNVFAMTVFIDWNEDGDFNDASESYLQNSPFVSGTGNPVVLVGAIAVPSGATTGTKRMRVKYNFQGGGTALQPALADACANMTNGQTEDYSVSVTEITGPPTCATFTAPLNNSTTLPSNGTMTWSPGAGATSYKLYIGTTTGGTDILNGTVVNGTSYQVALNVGTLYYAKVISNNAFGDATGCAEISFTTTNPTYCAADATSTSFEKIGNVSFANINNPSTSTAGYENFTSVVGTVNRSSTYTANVTISGYDTDTTNIWIDYNQDGIFDETTEKVVLSSAAVATGSITIPATAKLGNTRMRVRMHYSAIGGNDTACGTSFYGQVEDYTLNIGAVLAVSSVNKSNLSVYPNPFQDVINISDVKDVKSISIIDISGRLVKSLKPSTQLQVSDLKTGMYIVNLVMEDGTVRSIKTIKK